MMSEPSNELRTWGEAAFMLGDLTDIWKISDDEARQVLDEVENSLRDAMTATGWDVLEYAMESRNYAKIDYDAEEDDESDENMDDEGSDEICG